MNTDPPVLRIAHRPPRQPLLGATERFRPGDRERVERVVAGAKRIGLDGLRLRLSCADYREPGGPSWHDWLFERIARDLDVVPCLVHPALVLMDDPAPDAMPDRCGKGYVDLLDLLVTRHGAHFNWVELWADPVGRNGWDWHVDPDWTTACDIVEAAARRMRQRGRHMVLGGLRPTSVNWLRLICERGILEHCDAIGIDGTGIDACRRGGSWPETIGILRGILDRFDADPALWITDAGQSTSPCDGMGQADALLAALDVPAHRVYWRRYQDARPGTPEGDSLPGDDAPDHSGLVTAEDQPKLLARLLTKGGVEAVRALRQRVTVPTQLRTPRVARIGFGRKRAVIAGGAGFVGINLADRLAETGHQVLIFDNLSRAGVEDNLRWLLEKHRGRVAAEIADIRDAEAAREAVRQADRLFHFAAQVAVTTSLRDPVEDFEINARGTLNLLEAMRAADAPPGLVYTSSNKVYGALADVALDKHPLRYVPTDHAIAARGISEDRPLDFHSPYGCSKGAADQYVIDYARTYDLPAAVFRMSCVYGPHQRGTEDQGWVAHFLIQALQSGEIAIYGDGRQVRDILFVEDLVDALLLAQSQMPRLRAKAFNIGGGPRNTISLLELLDLIRRICPTQPTVTYGPARPGDQLYYVSDTSRFRKASGWRPTVSVEAGVTRLMHWLRGARAERTVMPQYERSAL